MALSVTASDLDLFLDLDGEVNVPRAELLISLAIGKCSRYVSPVPDEAGDIVLACAGRVYSNADGVEAHTLGPESVTYGTTVGGFSLTKTEIADLKRMAGVGGAFNVDHSSDDAGTGLYPWDQNIWGVDNPDELDDPLFTDAP